MSPAATATSVPGPEWLARWREGPWPTDQGLLRFDGLGAVYPEEITGRWRGSGLHTGHPLDGLLELYGWYGKAIETSEVVHPLLFFGRNGDISAIDPAHVPLGLALRRPTLVRSRVARGIFAASHRLLRTGGPTARLRQIEHRGVTSAAIVYDKQPIIDHLRRIDADRLLGMMDLRSTPPLFFLLSFFLSFSGPGLIVRASVGRPSPG